MATSCGGHATSPRVDGNQHYADQSEDETKQRIDTMATHHTSAQDVEALQYPHDADENGKNAKNKQNQAHGTSPIRLGQSIDTTLLDNIRVERQTSNMLDTPL